MADRNDPMVQAWIDEYTRVNQTKHDDCRLCGWPHASSLLCHTAPFGLAVVGGGHYSISGQNVDFMVRFRRDAQPRGFHWRNDVYFERIEDGVRISRIEQFNNTPQVKTWRIPLLEWQSIVSALGVDTSDPPILNCGKCEDRQECASGCVRHAAAQEAIGGVALPRVDQSKGGA